MIHEFLLALAVLLAVLAAACERGDCTTGWDPATMRCWKWCGGQQVEMVKNDDCEGKPTPVVVTPVPGEE